MTRRSRRTLPAALTALVLLALGALVATSAIQTLLERTPLVALDTVVGTLGRTSWQAAPVLVGAGVAAAVGVVLLVAAQWPGCSHVLPLATPPAGTDLVGGWHRTDLATRLRRRALAVEGVDRAAVHVRRRRVRVRARTHRASTAELRTSLAAALGADLDALGLARRPRLRVGVASTRKER
ncbi:DUF6286 domain-containing protein [Actinomycetospora straminea]|uniref:DUF6286 domain-containing protein n=1 Tax=Actinomycetospora straminea TaxID=663607 RepID=A0ABP9EJP4_9PSEU|nr:DUF6286 domain-containing protein [Actinomycetospora straminea]MDD7933246.1 DUF6286 domain-containing protein [Actinomycetospora straminea]